MALLASSNETVLLHHCRGQHVRPWQAGFDAHIFGAQTGARVHRGRTVSRDGEGANSFRKP